MDRLHKLIGKESGIKKVSRTLHDLARDLKAPVVGALQVSCADESEKECIQAFERGFGSLLPDLKFGQQSQFRIANLGARYEWGAVPVAEEHFAVGESGRDFKLLVVKINAHVSALRTNQGTVYGRLMRYGKPSACCGALDAMLRGRSGQPFLEDLREAFHSEGKDRIAMLQDDEVVAPAHKLLAAALSNARLQSQRAVVEIQDHRPETPTLYLVLSCVTVNREGEDSEILCGVYRADRRGEKPAVEYCGLAEDPSEYRIGVHEGALRIEDDQYDQVRAARDHRALVRREWESRLEDRRPLRLTEAARGTEFEKALEEVGREVHPSASTKPLLKTLLRALAHLSPISSAVMLFAEGIAGIHHLHRAHRLARKLAGDAEARQILEEIQARVDTLPPERARAVMDVLLASHPL